MENILEIYSDYLLCSTRQTTATGLSALSNGSLSHGRITRFLSGAEFDSKTLWLKVKPLVQEYENPDGCLIFDDTRIEKQYMDENDLICWHWDHSKGRNVKGINILSSFYFYASIQGDSNLHIPLAYRMVNNTLCFCEIQTCKEKRQSAVSKNEMIREMTAQQIKNQVLFKYILADSWLALNNNMRFIAKNKKFFIFNIKENRLSARDQTARNKSQWQNISSLDIAENIPVKVWLKDLEFPVLLVKQVFKNKDSSTGTRFLVSNGYTLSDDQFTTLYKKRWNVEKCHKNVKQNASIASSPTRSVRGQSNHLFASIFACVKLEKIKLAKNLNYFAMKAKIYMTALKVALFELNSLKDNLIPA
ncbi:MAG: transposase [Prevotellaceae bacterium]|jgi:hypothetical protein|nr:transposase [Prevotellaceae bacterium]